MSVTIFKNKVGAANGLFTSSPGGVLSVISVGDFVKEKSGASMYRAIVTDHPIEEAANANVMYAADGHIYMHVPGDKLGSLTVSGMAFSWVCDDKKISQGEELSIEDQVEAEMREVTGDDDPTEKLVKFNDKMTGFERILRWYRHNRVSNPYKNDPIEITFGGGLVLKGYLGSFQARVADVATRLYSFTLPMYLVPTEVKEFGPYDAGKNSDDSEDRYGRG